MDSQFQRIEHTFVVRSEVIYSSEFRTENGVHKKHFIYRLLDTLVVEKPNNRKTEYQDEKRYLFL